MNKILIACSGFKDVLNGPTVCSVLAASFKSLNPLLQLKSLPLSDGGEGFLSSLSQAYPSSIFQTNHLSIIGPLGVPILGEYGLLSTSSPPIAILELAKLSGIEFVPISQRNPYNTTNHGTGQVIQYLYSQGIKEFFIGLGGSATTDGGLSILYALEGFKFEFSCQPPAYLTGSNLKEIKSISINKDSNMLSEMKLTIACDVNNPMLGQSGSTYIFGPQKGIKPDMLEEYENLMVGVNDLLKSVNGIDVSGLPHAGAAGGIAGGLMACFQSVNVKRGIDVISDALGLEQEIKNADYVITGEGCYDSQTKSGKVVSKILELEKNAIIVCGINRSCEAVNIYDLVSRFGDKSISHVIECLEAVAKEIYENKILKYQI